MRHAGLMVLLAAAAPAQTRVDLAVTAGVDLYPSSGSLFGVSAVEAFIERSLGSTLSVSGRLVAELAAAPGGFLVFRDLGSSVRLQARLPSWDSAALYFELFPFDGHRVQSTVDHANLWGRPVRPGSVAPVAKVGFVWRGASVWSALRGYQQFDNLTLENRLRWTGLFGGAVELPHGLGSELIVTVSDRGDVPGLGAQGIATSVLAWGASGLLGWKSGGGVVAALDSASLAGDPARFARLFARERYQTAGAAQVGLEGGVASQNLEDPDLFGMLRRDLTGYADLQARLRLQKLRVFGTLRFLQANFVNFDSPGVPPFKALPRGTVTQDEYSGLLAADYRLEGLGLTPGVLLRIRRPATLKSPAAPLGGNNPPVDFGSRVVVMNRSGSFSILPLGERALPAFEATAYLLFNRFEALSALLVLWYGFDPNNAVFRDAAGGEPTRTNDHGARVDLYLQATF